MATILRGTRKGEEVEIVQWCNDWFSVKPHGIIRPTNIKLTAQEAIRVTNHKNNGLMFSLFELREDGTFKRMRKKQMEVDCSYPPTINGNDQRLYADTGKFYDEVAK